jgi:hypothetical protein
MSAPGKDSADRPTETRAAPATSIRSICTTSTLASRALADELAYLEELRSRGGAVSLGKLEELVAWRTDKNRGAAPLADGQVRSVIQSTQRYVHTAMTRTERL